MAALSDDQRACILRRYGALVRTYFSSQELRAAHFAYRAERGAAEVEFHRYLRLSAVLEAGRALSPILARIALAPSFAQERRPVDSRGRLDGRLDVRAYLRRRGRQTTPRTFPVWRVRADYATPENTLAASAGHALLAELQQLGAQLHLGASDEGRLARELVAEIEPLLREPVFGSTAGSPPPDLDDQGADALFARVVERWETRRISNRAYPDLWRWAERYRRRGLVPDTAAPLVGAAYAEDFDNRLFEIYALGCLRDALGALGFVERCVRPLRERGQEAALEVAHPDSGLAIEVFSQRGQGLLWGGGVPREWDDIGGIPDLVLRPRSSHHPLLIIDAKNRDRGSNLERDITEELYKMLGYFHNFSRHLRVRDRGPLGALIFRSPAGSGTIKRYASQQPGGALFAVALDPCDEGTPGTVVCLLEELLRGAGLLGDGDPLAKDVRDIKREEWTTVAEDPTDEQRADVEERVLRRLREVLEARYREAGAALRQARGDLEQHLLGPSWERLDEDERRMLATGEVFWAEHQMAFDMDFAPVVAELARALEVLLERLLFGPFRAWAAANGRAFEDKVLTLGAMRDMIELTQRVVEGRVQNPKPQTAARAQSFDDFLTGRGHEDYVYRDVYTDLVFATKLRNDASHKEVLTATQAREFRERLLGVGSAVAILARLVDSLSKRP